MNAGIKKYLHPQWIIPSIIFLFTIGLVLWIAKISNCFDLSHECFVQWDSNLYKEIAEKGHTLFYCGPEQGYPKGSTEWCGNAGWAPLYPWLIRLLHSVTGWSLTWSGVFIANAFFLFYLLIIARINEMNNFQIRNWLIIAIAALCPGNIYYHAMFPLSLAVFFMALLFHFLQSKKYVYAGIAGYFGILCYGIGFFLLIALLLYCLILFIKKQKEFKDVLFKSFAISALGLFTLFGYDYYQTGHWNALFLIQAKYQHYTMSPWEIFRIRMHNLLNEPLGIKSWVEIQNLFMWILIILLVSILIRTKNSGIQRWFQAFYLVAFWFIPFCANATVGLYRNAAMLGPGIVNKIKLPLWSLWLLLAGFIIFSIPMGMLFIRSWII